MATTQNTYTGNGSTTNYSFTFPYLAETDVKVKLNGVTQATSTYSFANATTISMNTAPTNGVELIIFRDTNNDAKKATFYPGSAIKAEDLNNDFDQILYVAQEVDNNAMSTLGDDPMQGDLPMGNNKLINLATPTAATDGTNKSYVDSTIDSKIDTAMASDVLAGTDISKSSSGGQVTISHDVNGADITVDNSDGNVIQDITITAQGHVTAVGSKNLNDVYYTESELNAGQLDNRYYTETELLNGALDGRYFTETEADARYFNVSTGDTIKNGDTFPDNDTTIATTAAINDRIIDLVDDVGGFVPIANETSFPDANPDVNNGAGTLVSIKALSSNLTSNGSGVAAITNGTVSNSTVTITGLDNSTTYNAGFGMIVETTTTLNTYTFHRQVPKATEVTTVAGSIANINTVAGNITDVNTFANVYRINAGDPNTHNDDGDLYYNTNDDKLYVFNGASWNVAASLNGSGGTVTGNTKFTDNTIFKVGTDSDLYIYHENTSHTSRLMAYNDRVIDLCYNETSSGLKKSFIECYPNGGSVHIRHGGVQKLATTSDGVTITGNQSFGDGNKIQLGAGDDLQIYHDGSNSYISNTHASSFYIQSNGNLLLEHTNGENYVKGVANGAVELYYDDVKKLETTSIGVNIHGGDTGGSYIVGDMYWDNGTNAGRDVHWDQSENIWQFRDDVKIACGNSSDLQIYHSGDVSRIRNTNDTGTLKIQATSNGENAINIVPNGTVEIYYDGVKKLETYASGVYVTGNIVANQDNATLVLGAGNDLSIYHDGSNSFIKNDTNAFRILADDFGVNDLANGEQLLQAVKDGAVSLYYDNSKKLETASDKILFHAHAKVNANDTYDLGASGARWRDLYISNDVLLNAADDQKIKLGVGNDLVIYHDGSHSYLKNGAGSLRLSVAGGSDEVQINKGTVDENMAKFIADGAVKLYYDNSKKLETRSDGVGITGILNMTSHIYLGDSDNLICGASNDLQIYHDGTSSYVVDTTSDLYLQSTNDDIIVKAADTIWCQVEGGENAITMVGNGQVELYYDNVVKFETSSVGAKVHGNLYLSADNSTILMGAGNDFQLWHDGTQSIIKDHSGKLQIFSEDIEIYDADAGYYMDMVADGAVRLAYDGSWKLTTTNIGIEVSGQVHINDNNKFSCGDAADLEIYHDGTNNVFKSSNGEIRFVYGDDYMFRAIPDAANRFYYDHSTKAETTSTGFMVNGHLDLVDNNRARFGSSDDLQLYHDGSHSYILNNTGNIRIFSTPSSEAINIVADGAVTISYANNVKITTTTNGIDVNGSVTESSDIALKNDINTIQNPLELIEQIRGIDFTWKNNGTKSMGVIAQDVEKVFPELVHGEEGSKAVQYSGLIGALVESVKELSAKVAALESS